MLRTFFQSAPELKSARELGLMREAGKIVAEALCLCRAMCKPGVRTIEIDRAVDALYAKYGALPLFKGYPGPNPKTRRIAVRFQFALHVVDQLLSHALRGELHQPRIVSPILQGRVHVRARGDQRGPGSRSAVSRKRRWVRSPGHQ